MHYQSGHETRCIKANLQYAALLNKWHDNVCEAGFKKKKKHSKCLVHVWPFLVPIQKVASLGWLGSWFVSIVENRHKTVFNGNKLEVEPIIQRKITAHISLKVSLVLLLGATTIKKQRVCCPLSLFLFYFYCYVTHQLVCSL